MVPVGNKMMTDIVEKASEAVKFKLNSKLFYALAQNKNKICGDFPLFMLHRIALCRKFPLFSSSCFSQVNDFAHRLLLKSRFEFADLRAREKKFL
jgi:hypothetical protein